MKRFPLLQLLLTLTITAAPVWADDVAIYGTQSVSLKPNVLIIFDNSGSMDTADVPAEEYDPNTTYPGSYSHNAVYYKKGNRWPLLTNDVENITYASAKTDLKTKGFTTANIDLNTLAFGGNRRSFYMGNFKNYDALGYGNMTTRLVTAKKVVTELLQDPPDVLFGLMVFNYSHGGRILEECGSTLVVNADGTESIDNSQLIDTINGLRASSYTPLAETLAEAGLYFAGEKTYFNCTSSTNCFTYPSPITQTCQKNYVIIVTDGSPTKDDDPLLYSSNKAYRYINGKHINQYGRENNPANTTSEYLDDVAAFLYNEDIHPMGAGTSFAKQSIITHTIGFAYNHSLLSETARLGGGQYFTANTSSGLKAAFEQIINSISEESSVFVAPVVPVNRTNPTSDSGSIYLAFFKPQQTGEWLGNLKKYKLNAVGDIVDANGQRAVNDDGSIRDNSRSLWTQSDNDGADVTRGGIGERLLDQATRNIYTYQRTNTDLTHESNRFATDNAITDDTGSALSNEIIERVHNGKGTWKVGAIIHSEPAVVHYNDGADAPLKTGIFMGTNDGLVRCIDDYTGNELWAFVPPGQLDRLSLLTGENHNYYVDGSPSMVFGGRIPGTRLFAPEMMVIGERRGGSRYYALDISNLDAPKWRFQISPTILESTGGETLGQSWGTPRFATIMTSNREKTDVIFFPGGYDPQQDQSSPDAEDRLGRAIFSVNASNGTLNGLNVNSRDFTAMTHSIVDINVLDHDADGISTRIFAGDMGGQVFAIADDIVLETRADGITVARAKSPDGTWSYKKKIFSTGGAKLFYAPTSAKIGGTNYLYFGSGNRESPFDLSEKNSFFAVKNSWVHEDLTPSDLVDVTNPNGQYDEALQMKKGWYFNLPNDGEKVVSKALVDSGIIYFTTYTPPATESVPQTDPCAGAGARGQGRLYAVNGKNGDAATDWGEGTQTRSTELPGNLPMGQPMIKDRKLRVGPLTFDLADKDRQARYYWNQK